MKKLLFIFWSITVFPAVGQSYLKNGSFEYGMHAGWEYEVTSTSKAEFTLDEGAQVMDGRVALKIDVSSVSKANLNSIKASTWLTAGSDSLYLLRFWARGPEESKVYVEVEGSETPGVLYEMHTGKTLFYFPFKVEPEKQDRELAINFFFRDDQTKRKIKTSKECSVTSFSGAVYYLDGVEVLDPDNKQHIDVINTYIWNHNHSGRGWVAGDNDISLLLPDGRTIWFFNDSFYATNDPKKNRLSDWGEFIRNGVVVQELDGTLITRPVTNQGGQRVYFEIPANQLIWKDNSVKNFFWVGDAIMEEGKVKVHLLECETVVQDGMETVVNTYRSYIASFSYPELAYLSLERQADFCATYETFFIDDEDDKIYLYRSEDQSYTHVARANLGNLSGNKESWEFWNGKTWTTSRAEGDLPAGRVNNMMADAVTKLGPGNYAQVSMPPMSHDVQVSFAPAPQGPWTPKETIYKGTPDSASWYYMPNFHGRLPNGNYSISISANFTYCLFFCQDCDTWAFVDKYWYRPRYIQFDLLAMSPYSEKKDCANIVDGDAYLDECGECVGGSTGKMPCVPEPPVYDEIACLSGVYVIQNKQSELFMSLENQDIENHALVVQSEYTGSESQQFELNHLGDGYYNIINVASGLPISPVDLSNTPGENIEQWNGLIYLDITDYEGGTVSAQYEASPATDVINNLFDNNKSTKYGTTNGRAWIQFQSADPQVVVRYCLMSANTAPMKDPKNWALYGSNDGETWAKLDTVSNIKFSRSEEKYFDLNNETAYSYYRMNMECYSGNSLQLAEWKLFVGIIPDGGIDNQQYRIENAGEGYVKFFNKRNHMLIEIPDGLFHTGAKLWQMPEIGQSGTLWKLIDPEELTLTVKPLDAKIGKPEIVIYPNPVKQSMTIQLTKSWQNADFSIYNVNGLLALSGKVSNAPLDVRHLPSGHYVVKVQKDDNVFACRLIKY